MFAASEQFIDHLLRHLRADYIIIARDVGDRGCLPARIKAEKRDLRLCQRDQGRVGRGQGAEHYKDRVCLAGDGILDLRDESAGVTLGVRKVHFPRVFKFHPL